MTTPHGHFAVFSTHDPDQAGRPFGSAQLWLSARERKFLETVLKVASES